MTNFRSLAAHALRSSRMLAVTLAAFGVTPMLANAAPEKSSSSTTINAAAIYHNYCSVCHGDKGDGRSRAAGSLIPPPKDFTTPASATQMSRARMIESVTHGRSGTAMTGWKTQLNQKEIESVVDYIRTSFMPASDLNETANRGRVVYSKNCSVCHGEKGDGRSRAQGSMMPPPRDFTSPAAKAELTRERMIRSATYGRPETAMAGFKTQLSAQDIEAAVDYIRTGFMASSAAEGISGISSDTRRSVPAASVSQKPNLAPATPAKVAVNMGAQMPNGLKGDPVKGAAFYMSNCSTCHGATGDGRGPRAYFILPKPRNFLHEASRADFNRPAIFNATKEGKLGTEMPAWGKVLSDQEIADVAEFVFQRFIQPSADAKVAKPSK